MTLLIATVAPDWAVVSQDSLFTKSRWRTQLKASGVEYGGIEEAETRVSTSSTAPLAKFAGMHAKLDILPHLHTVAVYCGPLAFCQAWWVLLNMHPPACDIDSLTEAAPEYLRTIGNATFLTTTVYVLHVGWSPSQDAVRAVLHSSDDDFAPMDLDPGHTMTPAPSPGAPGWDRIKTGWSAAERGVNVEDWHRRVALNTFFASREGLYEGARGIIGGELHTARIDRDGISVSASMRFPDYQDRITGVPIAARARLWALKPWALLGGAGRWLMS